MHAGRGCLVGAAALLVAAGCAKGGGSAKNAGAPPELHIIATAQGFEYPASVPSGMTHVVYENRDTTIHEAMFIRLAPGQSSADYVKTVKAGEDFPEGAADCSGVGLMTPGEHSEAWLRLEPGRYFLTCWYRDHLENKTPQTLTVTADSTSGVTPPAPDVTVKLVDFEFQLDKPIAKGAQVLKVEWLGPSMHEMDIFRLDAGKQLADFRAWMKNKKKGDPPGRGLGGILDEQDLGKVVWLKHDFTPGRYVMWCGMPMVTSGGNPSHLVHADAGMFREFEVR